MQTTHCHPHESENPAILSLPNIFRAVWPLEKMISNLFFNLGPHVREDDKRGGIR